MAYSLGLKLEENSPVVRAEVGIPFGSQHKGYKILLTSRYQNVLSNGMDATKTFAIGDLDDGEAWEFFKKMAGDSFESDEQLRDALQQLQRPYLNKSSCEISAEVHLAIELSINLLSSEDLKQIFLLCSLLRRDTRIEDLLRYACGLGLIKGVNTMKAARDRLLKIMSTLKESCLLLDSKSTNEEYFDVHDITYIVAKSIVSKDNQVLALTEEDNDEDVVTDWPNGESMKDEDLSLTLPDNFFKEAENLKVLDLTGVQFSFLPSSIGLLTSLSTLCLDYCKMGDNLTIIGALKNLNVLSLLQSDIKIVPKEIGQLLKLKLLDVSGCTKPEKVSADVLPQVQIPDAEAAPQDFFRKLQKLERYKIFIGKEWERFGYYQYLRTLKLRLNTSIDDLDHGIKILVGRTQALELDELKGVKIALKELTDEERLSHLQNLHIQNGFDIESITNDRNELPGLQSLTLQGLPQLVGFCAQDKIDATSLPQLELPLFEEKIWFPFLEKLQLSSLNVTRLQSLELKDLQHLSGFCFSSQNKVIEFPFMKSMTIYNCPNLEGFISRYTREGNQRISSQGDLFDNKVAFPKLQHLTVEGCDKLLTIFPSNMLTTFRRLHQQQVFEIMHEEEETTLLATAQLRELYIRGLPKLKYIWKNDPKGIFSFKKICAISVMDCRSLKNVFPASVAKDLPQLGYPSIFDYGVEEIVSKLEEGSESETAVNFEFDQLYTLILLRLPELKYY
ncbi:disease resistance protein RGA2-like [Gossypium hirsutum]|uniref:Disease resistance protein RGA2-like n=1 Tax=Gossypium hirsutum TaxID=3635 RepID=A0ABM2Z5S6_GOSHI|nr:disease resistance protein RGA2-like [Gossypium hirsutum]